MATLLIYFHPRPISAFESIIRQRVDDFSELESRLLGRADDQQGSFDSAATEFTDVVGWRIKDIGGENNQHWRDAAGAIRYAVLVTDMWADHVKDYKDTADTLIDEWQEAKESKEGQVPGEYQGDTITAEYPSRDGFFSSIGGSDANRTRDLYDDLNDIKDGLKEREERNWEKYQENAEEIKEMLVEGATPTNVQKLIDGGYANWSFYNIDPVQYSDLLDGEELTAERGEEIADELMPYWNGDKPKDDHYEELMLIMGMIGSNALFAQQNNSSLNNGEDEFLKSFYDKLEEEHRDGVIGIPGELDGDHMSKADREHALGVLGDGILALSDPALGGGWEDLPESVQRVAEGPYAHEDSDRPIYPIDLYMDEARALSQMFGQTTDDLQGGYGLSTNLALSTGSYANYWGDSGDDHALTDSQMYPLVDVASRNNDANYFMLTGTHHNPELGVDIDDSQRDDALEGLFTHQWDDEGETVRQFTDWLVEDLESDDYQEVSRAERAFPGFIETVTDPEFSERLLNTGTHLTEGSGDDAKEYENASFSHFNVELANSFGDVFDQYIYSFANSDAYSNGERVEGVERFGHQGDMVGIGAEERATYMQFLMGNDETAANTVESIDLYQQIELAAYIENGSAEETARGAGTLQALKEVAIEQEANHRYEDLGEQIDREKEITGAFVSSAGDLSDKIPVIGTAVSKGMDLGEDSIVNAIVDGEYEVEARHPHYTSAADTERAVRVAVLDNMVANDGEQLTSVQSPADLETLVENNVMTIEQDGKVIEADDIDGNFKLDPDAIVTVETEQDNWQGSANSTDGQNSMDRALRGVMTDTESTTTDGRTESNDRRVFLYGKEYRGKYNEINDFFGRDGDSIELSGDKTEED